MPYGKLISSLGSRKHSRYGFVNETAVRVGASIMFTIGVFTFLSVYYAGKYEMALYVVGFFFLDFILKVINPAFSLIGKFANYLVSKKETHRVGAIQKRFARSMGLIMSGTVFAALFNRVIIQQNFNHIPGEISRPMYLCIICLVFMWLEAILGRCAGCKIFGFLVAKKLLKNQDGQVCPDGSCSLS